jgi:hypothetical protein
LSSGKSIDSSHAAVSFTDHVCGAGDCIEKWDARQTKIGVRWSATDLRLGPVDTKKGEKDLFSTLFPRLHSMAIDLKSLD